MTAGISDDIPALFSLSFALGEYNGTIPDSNEMIRKLRRKKRNLHEDRSYDLVSL